MQEIEQHPIFSLETYGKVLITGGYLILDQNYSGLVGSTSNIRMLFTLYSTSQIGDLTLSVPQFNLNYTIDPLKSKSVEKIDNHFIRASLLTSLSYPSCKESVSTYFQNKGLKVVIQASKYFYGFIDQLDKPYTSEKIKTVPQFVNFEGFGKKTGMGSSSALITGLTSIIILYFQDYKTELSPIKIKNLSEQVKAQLEVVCQLTNSKASGKIGSGFDIAASIYGTHLYTRISPQKLHPFLSLEFPQQEWSQLIEERVNLNRNINLNTLYKFTMLNVNMGSDTRIMVSKVLKAIDNDFASNLLFTQLNHSYQELITVLTTQGDPQISALRDLGSKVRTILMEISELAEVPILPPKINNLLQEVLSKVPEVGYCSVPGAGGYDAVLLIGKDSKTLSFEELIGEFSINSSFQVSVLPIMDKSSSCISS